MNIQADFWKLPEIASGELLEEQLHSLRKDSPLLARFIDLLDVCIQVIDKNGNTVFYSKGVEILENFAERDVIGRPISEIYTIDGKNKLDEKSSMILKALSTGQPLTNQHMTFFVSETKKVDVITSVYPIFSGKETVGAVAVFRDITQAKQMSERIMELQRSLYQQKTNANGTQYCFDHITGPGKAMQDTISIAKKIALNFSPVLIQGETGTGKELFAQSIHNASPLSKGPFVAVNCAAIPETLLESVLFGTSKGAFTGAIEKPGLFEEAQDGTLFLDEINSMDMHLQTKLLRALQTKTVMRVGSNKSIPVNARIISAMNMDPKEALEKGLLRSDIYYRLSVVNLVIPPLRERTDCLLALTDHFIKQNNKIMGKEVQGLSKEVMPLFKRYNWPGNVRELEHAVEHAMNLAEDQENKLQLHHLPPYLKNKFSGQKSLPKDLSVKNLKQTLLKYEKEIIAAKLHTNQGNISQSAKELNVSRQYLQYRMKRLKMKE